MAKHIELPISYEVDDECVSLKDCEGRYFAGAVDEEANAAFIVKAVNEREGLFELLKLIRDDLMIRSESGVVDISSFIWDELYETIKQEEE